MTKNRKSSRVRKNSKMFLKTEREDIASGLLCQVKREIVYKDPCKNHSNVERASRMELFCRISTKETNSNELKT